MCLNRVTAHTYGMNAIDDIYSPENIARSRARAAWFRSLGEEGGPDSAELLGVAADIEKSAYVRERLARLRASEKARSRA